VVRLRALQEAAVLRRLAQGLGLHAVEWKAATAEQAWFCACKRTGNRRCATAATRSSNDRRTSRLSGTSVGAFRLGLAEEDEVAVDQVLDDGRADFCGTG